MRKGDLSDQVITFRGLRRCPEQIAHTIRLTVVQEIALPNCVTTTGIGAKAESVELESKVKSTRHIRGHARFRPSRATFGDCFADKRCVPTKEQHLDTASCHHVKCFPP